MKRYRVRVSRFIMGVPYTLLFNGRSFEMFDIVGMAIASAYSTYPDIVTSLGFNPAIDPGGGLGMAVCNNKTQYARIFLRAK